MRSSSKSYLKTQSRLVLTLNHLLIVDKALSVIAIRKDGEKSLARHAMKRNNELAIQLLYTHLNEYLRSILSEMYAKKPLEIAGKVSASLQFHEIINLGSFENVSKKIVDQVFRTLESQRSTRALIEKILDRTDVTIDKETFDEAMFYLEIRHLIVHNSSLIDAKFEANYGSRIKYAKAGNKIPMSVGMAKKAISSLKRLCHNIDSGLISKCYIDSYSGTVSSTDLPLETEGLF